MHIQALPAARLGISGWHGPVRHLGFRGRLASRLGLRAQPAPQRDGLPLQPAALEPAPLQPGLLRRARLVALAVGGFLLPWIVVLGAVLPASAQAQHWAVAWTGLDGAEAAAALVTAMLLYRGDRRASLPAAAGGTLLLLDAWFDVCTSAPGAEHAMALAEAACVEIPLAVAAWWLAIVLSKKETS